MGSYSTPNEPKKEPLKNPGQPGKKQNVGPEVSPAKPRNKTEVDLDKNKTKTYPDKIPPERH
jgi:hypothetical protein